jgi:hypothetical protein
LQQIQPQHQFQPVGLIPALSLVIARLDHGFPFAPRNDPFYLRQKFFFLCPYPSQFITQAGQTYLFIHTLILQHPARFPHPVFLRGVAIDF